MLNIKLLLILMQNEMYYSMKKLSEISVIICAQSEKHWTYLLAAISSIQQQILAPREIILVIDHNDRLLHRARASFPGLHVVANREEPGLAGARNYGIAVAQGELIAFLPVHAVAEQDWLLRLRYHCSGSRILGAGGVSKPVWPTIPPAWLPREFNWVVGCCYQGLPTKLSTVRHLSAGCYRRDVLVSVGGYRHTVTTSDNVYDQVGADTDLCLRIKQRWPQGDFLFDPHLQVSLAISQRCCTWSYFLARCLAEGRARTLLVRRLGANTALAGIVSYFCHLLALDFPCHLVRGLRVRNELLQAVALLAGIAAVVWGFVLGIITRDGVRCNVTTTEVNHVATFAGQV